MIFRRAWDRVADVAAVGGVLAVGAGVAAVIVAEAAVWALVGCAAWRYLQLNGWPF